VARVCGVTPSEYKLLELLMLQASVAVGALLSQWHSGTTSAIYLFLTIEIYVYIIIIIMKFSLDLYISLSAIYFMKLYKKLKTFFILALAFYWRLAFIYFYVELFSARSAARRSNYGKKKIFCRFATLRHGDTSVPDGLSR
jgi:hypothetical protein